MMVSRPNTVKLMNTSNVECYVNPAFVTGFERDPYHSFHGSDGMYQEGCWRVHLAGGPTVYVHSVPEEWLQ